MGNQYTSTVIRIYDESTGELLQKQCSKCGKVKDISEFCKNKRHSDGLRSNCKSCMKEWREANKDEIKDYHKEYYKVNKERRKEYMKEYYEANKETIREHHKEYIETDKWKEYYKDYHKKRYEANKDYYKNKNKEYRETPEGKESSRRKRQKYRTKKLGNGGNYTADEWNECLDYFNHCDAYTGEPLESTEIEHIIPVDRGGTTYIYNLVPANRSTNRSKGKKDLWEWYSKQPYFSWDRYLKICMWIIKNM